jgi:predicted lactoylglutathione lyase
MDQIIQLSCKNSESQLINLNVCNKNNLDSNIKNALKNSNKSDEIVDDEEMYNRKKLKGNL